jgi:hypothetical protein
MKNILLTILFFLPLFSNAASISELSPVSHWTCDETSGIRYDSTTNNNDLTDNNTVLYQTGLLGNACDFESTNAEYLSITDAAQTGLEPANYTISLWAFVESYVGYGLFTKEQTAVSGDMSYSLAYDASSPYYFRTKTQISGTNRNVITTEVISPSSWKHFVATYDGTWLRTYVNGVPNASSSYPGTINYGSTAIHVGYWGYGGLYYDGLIDEITFFNSALSASDVAVLYNSGTPLPYDPVDPPPEPTATTSTSTADMTDTNFMLAIVIFFLAFMTFTIIFATVRTQKK